MENERQRLERVYRERQSLAPRYSLDNPGNKFNYNCLHSRLADRLDKAFPSISTVRCLDLGSGTLFWPDEIIHIGVKRDQCIGSDLLISRLKEGYAGGRNLPAIACSAAQLPFPDNSFNLVTQFTMMTSVLDMSLRKEIASEIRRVLAPGGFVLWYDFRYNNPANKNTRAIGRREIRNLFAGMRCEFETLTLLPPLARKIPSPLSPVLNILHLFPMLRSHYLVMIGPKG